MFRYFPYCCVINIAVEQCISLGLINEHPRDQLSAVSCRRHKYMMVAILLDDVALCKCGTIHYVRKIGN